MFFPQTTNLVKWLDTIKSLVMIGRKVLKEKWCVVPGNYHIHNYQTLSSRQNDMCMYVLSMLVKRINNQHYYMTAIPKRVLTHW